MLLSLKKISRNLLKEQYSNTKFFKIQEKRVKDSDMLKMKKEPWKKLLFTNKKKKILKTKSRRGRWNSQSATSYTDENIERVHFYIGVFDRLLYLIVYIERDQNYGKIIDGFSTIKCWHIRFLFFRDLRVSSTVQYYCYRLSSVFFWFRFMTFLFPKIKNSMEGRHFFKKYKTGN